jgi:F-type H+-transporting ATPase subunit b
MDQVTSILRQLGVNNTFWIQLGYFFVCYIFMSQFLFKPYMKNLEFRKKNTTVNNDEATKLNSSIGHLAMDYQGQVKRQNAKGAAVYDKLKAEGVAEEDRLLTAAKKEAHEVMEQIKKKIQTDMVEARETLKAQTPQLSKLIASRVLGRELS